MTKIIAEHQPTASTRMMKCQQNASAIKTEVLRVNQKKANAGSTLSRRQVKDN
jgi:hypothetical protein